jgi:DNA-binding transcriptional LysR family regulator
MEAALGQQRSFPVGLVRVGHPVAATRFLAPRIPALLARHPGLKIELVVSDQLGDMIEDRLALAKRTSEVVDRSLIVRHAGDADRIVVASATYLERHGAPSVPDDLAHHRCIVHNHGPVSDLWTFDKSGQTHAVRVSGGFLANDAIAVQLAARSGYGIAFLPLVQVIDDLMSGDLLPVLSAFPASSKPVSLVYPSRRHLAPRTRVVLDFILDEMKQSQATLAAAAAKAGYSGLASRARAVSAGDV